MFMCAVTVFSGCALVQTNSNKLADSVCAKVGETTITRRDLVNYYIAVLNQGYQYSIEDLLEELINQKLIVEDVKNNLASYVSPMGEEVELNGTTLKDIKNKAYYNKAMQQVYDYLDGQILNYENSIRAARGESKIVEDEKSSTKTDYDKESLYESKVEKNSSNQIVLKFDKVEFEDKIVGENSNTYGYNYLSIDHGDPATRQLAYERFIQALIRNEKGKNLDTNEQNVLNREIERVFKIYEEQQYLDFFKEKYQRETDLNLTAVVNRYKQLVRESYSQYALEGDNAYSTYVKAMQSDSSAVYYHPYASKTDGKGFIKVAHVLIKFTDKQLADTENDDYLSYKEIMEIEDETEKQNALEAWKQNCSGKARYLLEDENEDASHLAGNEYGENIDYMTIYNEIQSALNACTSLQEKAEVFNNFVYKYSQDKGSINPSKFTYYSVSIDDTVKESWVKEFADAAREAYKTDGEGSLSAPIYVNNVTFDDNGSVKEGTYAGYHMIFVLDEYDNLCDINSLENLGADFAETLYNTRVMLGVEEKSLFDLIYDSLSLDGYSTFRQNRVKDFKQDVKIVYYKSNYEDLIS